MSELVSSVRLMAFGLNGYSPALRNPAITFAGVTALHQA